MAHDEHNRPKKSGAFALIILGALLFISAPTLFGGELRELGMPAIVLGFIVGGFGFYLKYIKNRAPSK